MPGADAAPEAPDQKPAPVEISYQGKKRVVTVPAHLQEEPPLRGIGPLLGDAGIEGLLAAKARGELERLAAAVPEAREDRDQEVGVGDRLADLEV